MVNVVAQLTQIAQALRAVPVPLLVPITAAHKQFADGKLIDAQTSRRLATLGKEVVDIARSLLAARDDGTRAAGSLGRGGGRGRRRGRLMRPPDLARRGNRARQSKTTTPRATSPASIAAKAWLISSSAKRRLISSSSCSRPPR